MAACVGTKEEVLRTAKQAEAAGLQVDYPLDGVEAVDILVNGKSIYKALEKEPGFYIVRYDPVFFNEKQVDKFEGNQDA